jgi:hypothetical protein
MLGELNGTQKLSELLLDDSAESRNASLLASAVVVVCGDGR